jgi:hypothetical protein
MTVKDLIKHNDYDYMMWRITLPEWLGGGDTFMGATRSEGGKLISLDGDTYYEDREVLRYREWRDLKHGIENGVTIVIDGEWK